MDNKLVREKYICEKRKCTGCKACVQICPKNAIDIIVDFEGFEYPIKNEKCIDCGLCQKICPQMNKIKYANLLNNRRVLVCRHKNEQIVEKSSSGGAFTTIVEAFCDKNYIIFGVEFTESCKAVHSFVTDKKDIDKYRKSKYVQSDIGNSYIQVEAFLKEGKKVLFTGTPCQIAGLKQYLKKDNPNLLTVDIICHGVPSHKVLNSYVTYMENKYACKANKVQFRKKTIKNNIWNSKNMFIQLQNGKQIIEDTQKNLYLRGFHANLYCRPSCYSCKFANPNRISDITIADCWGIEKKDSTWNVHEGASMMIINSAKGEALLEKIEERQIQKELDLAFAIENNAQFREPTKYNPKRKYFFDHLDKIIFDKLIHQCIPQKRIRTIIRRLIPKIFKEYIKKINYGGMKNEKI